ncbi:unnamed protein product [Schistosoma margrebowiei]|uniref:Uncharacterized protein n=1 Tax=Schistosoma margrebowiei TaxID=48269 RepID=A0A183LMH3_9TREM|nr:unnamed protein product [Schistosoma margrebowiei]
MPLLTTRATINLGTWNPRTLWEASRVIQIAAEMKGHNLEAEQQRLVSKELLLYSDHEEENAPHTHEVAFMLFHIHFEVNIWHLPYTKIYGGLFMTFL